MALKLDAKQKTDFGKIGACSVHGRAVLIIDLGTQHNTDIKTRKPQYHVLDAEGKWAKDGNDFLYTTEDTGAPDLSPKVYINFELPTKRIDVDGESKPRWIGKEYTLSGGQNALLPKVLAAAGVEDLPSLLDKPVMISVGVTSGGNDKITAVSPPMDGMEVGLLENTPVVFDFDEPDMEQWDKIPNWLQNKIKEAVNYEGSDLQKLVESAIPQEQPHMEDFDDDVPY